MSATPLTPAPSSGVMTPEAGFLQLYTTALGNLQNCWMGSEEFNEDKFQMQLTFLRNLIPDKDTRDAIEREFQMEITRYKKLLENKDHAPRHAGLSVVSHMVEFLCQSFDLIHIDITGPATSKQYRDAVIEVPDYPAKKAAAAGEPDGNTP